MKATTPTTTTALLSTLLHATWLSSLPTQAFQVIPRSTFRHHGNSKTTPTTSLFSKKILVCFDGSGNSPEDDFPNEKKDKSFTNILRLHLLAGGSIDERPETPSHVNDQVSLYIRGVGSSPSATSSFKLITKLKFALGTVYTDQVFPMEKRFRDVYEDGDSVYIFGFSRGAASARIFSNEILKKNIVPSIEFLGVFDTVLESQFINPVQIKRNEAGFPPSENCDGSEHEGQLHPNIKKAVHCVSLDDPRFQGVVTFAPTLMGQSERVTEVWFPGDHNNIGGGYYNRGVSDVVFEYMKDMLISLDGDSSLEFLKAGDVDKTALVNSVSNNTEIVRAQLYIDPRPWEITTNPPNSALFPTRLIDAIREEKSDPEATVKIHESLVTRMIETSRKDYNINKYLGTNLEESLSLDRVELVANPGKLLKMSKGRLRVLIAEAQKVQIEDRAMNATVVF